MFSLFGVPVDAAYHVVTAISAALTPLTGGLAVAAAIIVFTVIVRLIVVPFSYYAMRGQVVQARIAPQVQALRQRYAKQPERLTRELTALYRENGTGMFSGCLPLLLQWPFLSVMYLLFRSTSIGGAPNGLLAHHLFAAQLGSHWLGGAGPLSAQGAVFAALFLLLVAIGWLAARASRRLTPPTPTVPAGAALARTSPTETSRPRTPSTGTVPAGSRPLAARGAAAQPTAVPPWVMNLLPYLTAVFAAFLPLAAGLYLLTTAAWTLLERSLLRRVLSPASAPGDPGTGKAARSD
jgi:YidC/Oxa1 family membrane protein insertase